MTRVLTRAKGLWLEQGITVHCDKCMSGSIYEFYLVTGLLPLVKHLLLNKLLMGCLFQDFLQSSESQHLRRTSLCTTLERSHATEKDTPINKTKI